jgi:hypothetical protein
MDRDAATGLLGSLALLALVLLGLTLIVRGVFSGFRTSPSMPTAPVGFGQGALGRTPASLLSFAVAYKFFFERYTAGVLSPETALGIALLVLAVMVPLLWPRSSFTTSSDATSSCSSLTCWRIPKSTTSSG